MNRLWIWERSYGTEVRYKHHVLGVFANKSVATKYRDWVWSRRHGYEEWLDRLIEWRRTRD